MPPAYIDGLLLRTWRTRTRRSQDEAAADLGISVEQLAEYETGDNPVSAGSAAARALEHRLEPLSMNPDGARERWVALVDDARAYFNGEPVISRLLRESDRGRLRRFLSFIIVGPDPRLALTDPALYQTLRTSCTRALLAGWGRYRVGADGRIHRSPS